MTPMVANILSSFEFTNTSVSMLMLLVKATLILVVALGITLSMQRASAGSRHLVWLVTLATLLLVPRTDGLGADYAADSAAGEESRCDAALWRRAEDDGHNRQIRARQRRADFDHRADYAHLAR
jgi:hypothetical protein